MNTCGIHTKFFEDACTECKKEYAELKGQLDKGYREFTEERAKRLYTDLLLQFLKNSKYNEVEASEKAKSIIRKQCRLRNMQFWPWL
jgi:hypothetical protein